MTKDDLREEIADLVASATGRGLQPDAMIDLLCEMAGLLSATGKTGEDQLALRFLGISAFQRGASTGWLALPR